jgi:dTDP-4-amino-4,6-dideoxygalactose transaminase
MVEKSKIWLSSPHMGSKEQEYVNEAFATNWLAPLGPNVDGFEKDLQDYNKVAHAAALTSGTGAMHIALDLLNVRAGDYVICQSMTFCASTNPIIYLGATPVLVDSEIDTWNLCPIALEVALKDLQAKKIEVKAIIVVHLYGNPAKMKELLSIAKKYSVPIVEDAAESIGSIYQGKKTGTLGEMGVYSFNGNKIITTSGGGALVSQNKVYINKARFLATQARDEAPHYQHSTIGYNYRMSNILAGIGRGQMIVLDKRIEQRRSNQTRYRQFFENQAGKDYSVEFQEEESGSFSNRWLSAILLDPAKNKDLGREDVRLKLAEANIEARPLWKPMHLQPVYAWVDYYTVNGLCSNPNPNNSVSDRLFEHGLCLPSGSNLTEKEWQRIEYVLNTVFA